MKHDLQITLNVNAIESDGKLKSDGGGLVKKVFRSRLLNFVKKNPEVDEVPEEKLPHPFNRSNQVKKNLSTMMNPISSSFGTSSGFLPGQQICAASHSFKRHFSKQFSSLDVVQVSQEPSNLPATLVKNIYSETEEEFSSIDTQEPSNLPATTVKNIYSETEEEFSSIDTQGTPTKLVSTPVRLRLMSNNYPAQKPLKRSIMSPDDDSVRSFKRSRRSIKFDTPVKNSMLKDERLSVDDDIFDIHSESLLESIREKEKKALEEKDLAISEAKWRQQMIARLPKLVNTILFLFRSINQPVITKQELVHRIISSHFVERREVDEQLRLLQELVPEWICEKKTTIGDLFWINRFTCPELIRTGLAGEK